MILGGGATPEIRQNYSGGHIIFNSIHAWSSSIRLRLSVTISPNIKASETILNMKPKHVLRSPPHRLPRLPTPSPSFDFRDVVIHIHGGSGSEGGSSLQAGLLSGGGSLASQHCKLDSSVKVWHTEQEYFALHYVSA